MSGIQAAFAIRRGDFTLQAELDLPGRGVIALSGPSGAGKTSLLRAIAGLERHAGSLIVNGETWQDDSRNIFLPTHRRPLGYVFQEASLLPHLSVAQNLDYGMRRSGHAMRPAERDVLLRLLGVEQLLARRPESLSGGERQRVAIARALLTRPRLLLMDEPLAALDAQRKQEVLPYLERLHDELEIPILYVSHAPDEVARLADYIVLLGAGRVLGSGPVGELTARLDLPSAFDEAAGVVLEGRVQSFDAPYQMLQVGAGGALIQVPHRELATGTRLRLRILARDVSLSLARHDDSSIVNQLPARVEDVVPANTGAHVVVRLNAGGLQLLARLTRQSRDRLGIEAGVQVWAQFKGVAVWSG